jgi:hypothetical protein
MPAASTSQPVGKIANVSASLIVPAGAADKTPLARMMAISELLVRLFEDVVVVGDLPAVGHDSVLGGAKAQPNRTLKREPSRQSGLADLVLVLEAAREERMLVVAADNDFVTAGLLLGLTAWPEHECVAPRIDGAVSPLCALYQREVALPVARESLERGESELSCVLNQLDCGLLEGDDLAALLTTSR